VSFTGTVKEDEKMCFIGIKVEREMRSKIDTSGKIC
jgi:hypothetical protein